MSSQSPYYLFYSLDNCILNNVPSNPYLGLEISHDLKWHSHVNNITSKASRTLGFLQRNLQHCTKDCRRTAYLSLVRSTLEYGSIIWDSHYKCDIDKLERIQNRAARFIKKDYHSKDPGCMTNMLKELELPSLQERRKQLRLIFMFKVVEGLVPAMPSDQLFKPRNTNKRHIKTRKFENCVSNNLVERSATNNSKPYVVPRSFTDQFRNSFFVRTVNDWNQLEEDCVTSTTIEQFKKRISLRD